MNSTEEKRRFNRVDCNKSVKIFPVLPSKSGNIYEVQSDFFEGTASNISEGGLRLETNKSLAPDFLLKLHFEVVENEPIEVYVKIIWSHERRCGVRFMYLDPPYRKSVRSFSQKDALKNN